MPQVQIEELKPHHLAIIVQIASLNAGRVAFVIPDQNIDALDDYARYVDTQLATEHLVKLNLITDVTNEESSRPLLESLAATGRAFKVFELSKMGAEILNTENDTWKN